jgi:hypothetical protein
MFLFSYFTVYTSINSIQFILVHVNEDCLLPIPIFSIFLFNSMLLYIIHGLENTPDRS